MSCGLRGCGQWEGVQGSIFSRVLGSDLGRGGQSPEGGGPRPGGQLREQALAWRKGEQGPAGWKILTWGSRVGLWPDLGGGVWRVSRP